MLGGLPNEYKPMILGIEKSETKLTVDYVKNLLLQEIVFDGNDTAARSEQPTKRKSDVLNVRVRISLNNVQKDSLKNVILKKKPNEK